MRISPSHADSALSACIRQSHTHAHTHAEATAVARAMAMTMARKGGDGDACKRMKMNIDGEWIGLVSIYG